MGEPTHLSKLTIQEIRDEVNEARDRGLIDADFQAYVVADHADTIFFIANRKVRVQAIRIVLATIGTDAGAQNVMVRKLTGVQGPAAGVALLAAAFDLKTAVANTPAAPALTAVAVDLELAPGDRLAVDFTGLTTGLTNSVVQVLLIPI